jgi:hypothetical protein
LLAIQSFEPRGGGRVEQHEDRVVDQGLVAWRHLECRDKGVFAQAHVERETPVLVELSQHAALDFGREARREQIGAVRE